jgi:phosphatidylglycerophosphatase A
MVEQPPVMPSEENAARASVAIATVFGIGFAPFAPGTVASLVALPIAWLIAHFAGRFALLVAAVLVCALGAWACEIYVLAKHDKDPSECVIDEVAGQWIICAFAPPTLLAYAVAFALFRALDISKLWPISWVERTVPRGLGVMTDDVAAALIGGIVITVLTFFGLL